MAKSTYEQNLIERYRVLKEVVSSLGTGDSSEILSSANKHRINNEFSDREILELKRLYIIPESYNHNE